MTNEFSENLSLNDVKARYDAQCKRVLSQKELHMSDQLGKEMHLMCNLSDLVEEHGIQRGRKYGMEEKSREIAKKLLKLGTMSEEEILQVTEISKEQLDKIKETL